MQVEGKEARELEGETAVLRHKRDKRYPIDKAARVAYRRLFLTIICQPNTAYVHKPIQLT